MRIPASSLIGLGLLLYGAAVVAARLAGALSQSETGIRQTQLNGAVCFALVGAALAAESFVRAETLRFVRSGFGSAVAVLAGLVLLQHAFQLDLGIDLPQFHGSGVDDAVHPGRMSLPTTLAFLLAAFVLMRMDRVRGIRGGLAVQGATIGIFLIGLVGFGGQAIHLRLMYPESTFAAMARFTAIGLIVVCVALWLAWRRMQWYQARRLTSSEEQQIGLAGSAVIALIVCAAVVSGFALMADQLKDAAQRGLLESLKTQIRMVDITIDARASRANMMATRPFVVEQLSRLKASPSDASALGILGNEADNALRHGFSAMSFSGLHGEWRRAGGNPVERPAFDVPVDGARRTVLKWNDDFVLYSRIIVERGGEPVGVVVAEQPLTQLRQALREADDFRPSAEIAVCRHVAAEVGCVRQKSEPLVFRLPQSRAPAAALAFKGVTDVYVGRDARGRMTMAAHGPVGKTGLVMTLAVDTDDLYATLRDQLFWAFVLMAGMIALGVWLLRHYLAPLVRRLAMSEERLALALEGSRLAPWDMNVRAGTVWLDPQWARMVGSGSGPTQTTSQDLMRMVHPDDVAPLRQHLAEVLGGAAAHYDVEHRVRKSSGEWLWIHSRGKVVERDAAGRAVRLAGINVDIDLRKQLELRLAHQAGHDALTGLPNRNLFQDRMTRAIARSRRHRTLMAVMYLDIDKFKGINDTYGHDVGDALIRGFARRLVDCIRNTDTAARLGGDEFAVILEELEDAAVGRRVAEKIVAAMREAFALGERTLSVSTSVGVAFYSGIDEVQAEAIVKQADRALYEAKAAGRDTYRVSAEKAA